MNRLPTPMFQASVNVRGSQMRHSASARTMSRTMSETRPTWDAACSVQRPTFRGRLEGSGVHKGTVSSPPMARKSTPRTVVRRARAEFRRRLLRWFRRHGRDLPWRRTRDPYHVIVSEFMLQQTQVSQGARSTTRASSSGTLRWTPWPRRAGARWCGRAGRAWATTAAPRTSTGSRRTWCGTTRA